MPAITLSPTERKAFRAQAHHLEPVVMIGQEGLNAAVISEANMALSAHALIKIRVHSDDRDLRLRYSQELAEHLNAAPIQLIGKLIILWRPLPVKEKKERENRKAGPKEVKVLKYSKRGGQAPEVKRLTVLGNQRLTSGGQVKRAKTKMKSAKKSAQI